MTKVKERSQYYNMLVYGDSGVGKTTLAGSADAVPAMRPVLFVDIEGGTTSLVNSYPDADVVRVTSWREMQDLYNELYKGESGYQTVVLDSLTEIQKFNMYNVMGDLIKLEPGRDPDIPGMREWGKNIEQIRKFVRGFRDLPMNTIFTALVREEKNQRTGVVKTMPLLSGKLAQEVGGMLDIVVYYYVKEMGVGDDKEFKRILLTQATEANIAKDRSGRLPQVIVGPTMMALWELMSGTATTTIETKETKAS